MPKVLHLIHSFNRGGIEKWLLSLLKEIPRTDYEMDVCCKGGNLGPLANVAIQSGAQVLSAPLGPFHIGFAQRLKQILKEGHYSLLHSHQDIYSGFPIWIAHQLQVPVITSFHNTHFAPQTPLTRLPLVSQCRALYGRLSIYYTLHHSDCVTGCSEAVLKPLRERMPGAEERARVLYYGGPIPPPMPPEQRLQMRQAMGCSDSTPLLLHVGRLIEQKNQVGLLQVFHRVVEQLPSAQLLIVGEGPLKPLLERTIQRLKLEQSVHLLGARDDVPQLMQLCDVFLLPSFHEGLPVVAVEASAAGLPLVGSRIPGLTEAVRDGETARLHDVLDVQGMAESTLLLLTDRPYAQRLAIASRAWGESRFSVQASARQVTDLYRSLIAAKEPQTLLGV